MNLFKEVVIVAFIIFSVSKVAALMPKNTRIIFLQFCLSHERRALGPGKKKPQLASY